MLPRVRGDLRDLGLGDLESEDAADALARVCTSSITRVAVVRSMLKMRSSTSTTNSMGV